MTCIGFRRALSADPASRAPELLEHRARCAECDAFARRQAAFERALGEAVRIAAPEGLAARVLVAHGLSRGGEVRARRRTLAGATAAGLALALAGAWLLGRAAPLDRAVFAHIDAERAHLADRRGLSAGEVNAALEPLGIAVDPGLGPVHYAGTCDIRSRAGGHLVLPGERGPVTVLFMPGEAVAARWPIRGGGLEGVLVPAAHGSMAIVGEPGEALEAVEERLRRSVRFLHQRRAEGRPPSADPRLRALRIRRDGPGEEET